MQHYADDLSVYPYSAPVTTKHCQAEHLYSEEEIFWDAMIRPGLDDFWPVILLSV